MSKSKWKDLPEFENINNYQFIDNATHEEWTWELLRRRLDYRTDCDYYWPIVKNAKKIAGTQWRYSEEAMHYIPQKLDGESHRQWIHRAIMEDLEDPARVAIHDYFPEKWGLNHMAPYDQPYGKYVGFRPHLYRYPRLIQDAESLTLLIEEKIPKHGSNEAYLEAVKDDVALIAFDLTRPLGSQITHSITLLKKHYKEIQKYKKVKRTTVPKLLSDHLVRHLRVLDAKRAFPDITAADIARKLGYEDFSMGSKTASQQGVRWLNQAKNAQDNYLHFLITAQSTTKNI